MKRAILWLMQSFFYLVPAAIILVGIYVFVRFLPEHAAWLSFIWVIVVSFIYIKYNKWY